MTTEEHPHLRKATDSGDVYAYAYGALAQLADLLINEGMPAERFAERHWLLAACVETKMVQLQAEAEQLAARRQQLRPIPSFWPEKGTTSPIYVTDEKAGEQASE